MEYVEKKGACLVSKDQSTYLSFPRKASLELFDWFSLLHQFSLIFPEVVIYLMEIRLYDSKCNLG